MANFYFIKMITHRAIDAALSPSSQLPDQLPRTDVAFVPLSINDASGRTALEFASFLNTLMKLQRRSQEEKGGDKPWGDLSPQSSMLVFPPTLSLTLHITHLILFVRLWMSQQHPWKALVSDEQVASLSADYERCLVNLKTAAQ